MTNNRITRALGRLAVLLPLVFAGACTKKTKETADGDAPKNASASEAAADGPAKAKANELPAADALLAKAVEAAGGKATFDACKAFYYEGHLVIAGQRLEAAVKLWWKEGSFYTEQDMKGVGQVRAGKDGDQIWSDDPINGLRELRGLEAEQVAWLSSLMLAADWQRHFANAETVEEVEEDGAKLYIVKLTSEDGAEMNLKLDAKTGLQRGLAFEQATPMGSIPLKLKMEDYRDFEGMKLAYRQVTEIPLANATLEIEKIELNPEISPARFQMPKSGAGTVSRPAGAADPK